jgi:hypothetical protein
MEADPGIPSQLISNNEMKYNVELLIDKPSGRSGRLSTIPDKLNTWQTSLTAVELFHGTSGQPGAESKLIFEENGLEFSLVERVISCQEPESIVQSYKNQFSANTVKNSFLEQGQNQTLWVTETEYKFKTLLMKVMGPVYKKNLVARTQRGMERFKEMVEDSPSE